MAKQNFHVLHIRPGSIREGSQIDFSMHNVKRTLWGWGALGVDVIDLTIDFFLIVIIKPSISIKTSTNICHFSSDLKLKLGNSYCFS